MRASPGTMDGFFEGDERLVLAKPSSWFAPEFRSRERSADVFLWDARVEDVSAVAQANRLSGSGPVSGDVMLREVPKAEPLSLPMVEQSSRSAASPELNLQPIIAAATTMTATFRDGLNGYVGTADVSLQSASPTRNFANSTTISLDNDPGIKQALLKFTNLFGAGPGQIPVGAEIISARLSLTTTNKGDGAILYRMAADWTEAGTNWNAWGGNGIQANGVEAFRTPELVTGYQQRGSNIFDVTASLNAWSQNPQSNFGWALLPSGADGWDIASSESGTKPQLSIEYRLNPVNTPPLANDDSATVQKGMSVVIQVLANDTDADLDPLSILSFGQGDNGTVALNSNGTLTYTPQATFEGQDSFTYVVSDGRGGTDEATARIDVQGLPLATSFMATQDPTGWLRSMQHDNAAKSFYHDGQWFAVLPNNGFWYVHKAGSDGGTWQIAGSRLADTSRAADVQYDATTGSLYVLQANSSSTKPMLYKLAYDGMTDSWNMAATVQLGGLGGVLSGLQWQKNPELTLGLDPVTHLPIISCIGPSTAPGLQLAYATSSSLASWSQSIIDADTNSVGGSNGNSKADIVSFTDANGAARIAIVYSADGTLTDNWRSVSHAAGGGYEGGWTSQVITNQVGIDNHISAVSDGSRIYMVMKDDANQIWFTAGTPEAGWGVPQLVVGVGNPSRPTLVLDETHDRILIFFQESTWDPYGSIYMKTASTNGTEFDAMSLGTQILTASNGQDMIDPQVPSHAVGADTGGFFYLFAKNQDAASIWYNDLFV